MNDQDRAFARKALESKRLTIEQVQEIRLEVDRSGRPFAEVAAERGLLKAEPPPPPKPAPAPLPAPVRPTQAPTPPAAKLPILYTALIGGSLVIFVGLLVGTLALKDRMTKVTADEAVEIQHAWNQSDRQAGEAGRGYKRAVVSGNEAVARGHLDKARAAMARVEKLTDAAAIAQALNEAFIGYNMYLKELPDDVEVRIERAGTHQARRNYDLAIADLERAIELRRDLEPALRERIAQLRLFLARKPQ